jgi:hypothetical protein
MSPHKFLVADGGDGDWHILKPFRPLGGGHDDVTVVQFRGCGNVLRMDGPRKSQQRGCARKEKAKAQPVETPRANCAITSLPNHKRTPNVKSGSMHDPPAAAVPAPDAWL